MQQLLFVSNQVIYIGMEEKDKLSARHLEEGAAMSLLYTNSVIFL